MIAISWLALIVVCYYCIGLGVALTLHYVFKEQFGSFLLIFVVASIWPYLISDLIE